MNTQLLKLDQPYDIICGSNKIAKHVATLIVANVEKENTTDCDFPGYVDMHAYSFPVVEYGNGSAAGDVWMDVEVRDCRVIAKAPKENLTNAISANWFCETLRFLYLGDEIGSTQTPYTLYEQLRGLGISVDYLFNRGMNNEVNVELDFDVDEKLTSIISVASSKLFFIADYATRNPKQKQEEWDKILRWAGQYLRILNAKVHFTTKQEEFKEMLEGWNQAIDKAA